MSSFGVRVRNASAAAALALSRALVVATAAAGLVGCAARAPMTTLKIEAPRAVNGGRPVHVLVRNIDGVTFVAESYPAAAARVVTPDPSVLESDVVYPGSVILLSVPKPEKGDLAVYFFFYAPAAKWKLLLDRPFDDEVDIRLGADRVEAP